MMMQAWKIPEMVKGGLTWLPVVNAWRRRRASTGGTDSARYCYSVWLRHLVLLAQHGFHINQASVGELGPGDSIGTGLVALLCGANHYVGLDVVPFSAHANLPHILGELTKLYEQREPIPDHKEFPNVRPILPCYDFPAFVIESRESTQLISQIQEAVKRGINGSEMITYHAPWFSSNTIIAESLDLIFSQSVLQYVDKLEETYRAMFTWLKPGGYASHWIGLWAHQFSPYWNGHWAYTDWQWRLVRGQREILLNRQPLTVHLHCATRVGFEVLCQEREYASGGLPVDALTKKFRAFDDEDLQTRGAMVILRKPLSRDGEKGKVSSTEYDSQ
jgi:SAM-dependent methyltransferase